MSLFYLTIIVVVKDTEMSIDIYFMERIIMVYNINY